MCNKNPSESVGGGWRKQKSCDGAVQVRCARPIVYHVLYRFIVISWKIERWNFSQKVSESFQLSTNFELAKSEFQSLPTVYRFGMDSISAQSNNDRRENVQYVIISRHQLLSAVQSARLRRIDAWKCANSPMECENSLLYMYLIVRYWCIFFIQW